jgi:hypothetical protein
MLLCPNGLVSRFSSCSARKEFASIVPMGSGLVFLAKLMANGTIILILVIVLTSLIKKDR